MRPRIVHGENLKILRRGGDYPVSCTYQPATVMTLQSSSLPT